MITPEIQRLRQTLETAPEAYPDLLRDLSKATNPLDISEVLMRHGYDIPAADVAAMALPEGDLTEDQLESVTGGNDTKRIFAGLISFGISEIIWAANGGHW